MVSAEPLTVMPCVVAVVVTTNNYHDSQLLPNLLGQVSGEVAQVSGDGAYDRRTCYEAIRARHALR